MSASAAPKTTTRRPAWLEPGALQRARLTVVPRPRVAVSRFPFVTLVTLILLGGVVGLLCFNTSMQQAAFTEARLTKQATTLAAQQQALESDLEHQRDPQHVAELAARQGMVIPGTVAMLHVATGRISGDPEPANGDVTPPLWPAIRKPSFN